MLWGCSGSDVHYVVCSFLSMHLNTEWQKTAVTGNIAVRRGLLCHDFSWSPPSHFCCVVLCAQHSAICNSKIPYLQSYVLGLCRPKWQPLISALHAATRACSLLGFSLQGRVECFLKVISVISLWARAKRSRTASWRLELTSNTSSPTGAENHENIEKLGSLRCIWESRLLLLPWNCGIAGELTSLIIGLNFPLPPAPPRTKKNPRQDLWNEGMHFLCWGMSLSLWWWFLGNHAAGFLIPSSHGFVSVSEHWRTGDSGSSPKTHTLLYVLYWCFCDKSTLDCK